MYRKECTRAHGWKPFVANVCANVRSNYCIISSTHLYFAGFWCALNTQPGFVEFVGLVYCTKVPCAVGALVRPKLPDALATRRHFSLPRKRRHRKPHARINIPRVTCVCASVYLVRCEFARAPATHQGERRNKRNGKGRRWKEAQGQTERRNLVDSQTGVCDSSSSQLYSERIVAVGGVFSFEGLSSGSPPCDSLIFFVFSALLAANRRVYIWAHRNDIRKHAGTSSGIKRSFRCYFRLWARAQPFVIRSRWTNAIKFPWNNIPSCFCSRISNLIKIEIQIIFSKFKAQSGNVTQDRRD